MGNAQGLHIAEQCIELLYPVMCRLSTLIPPRPSVVQINGVRPTVTVVAKCCTIGDW
jgi:hypothetical protein